MQKIKYIFLLSFCVASLHVVAQNDKVLIENATGVSVKTEGQLKIDAENLFNNSVTAKNFMNFWQQSGATIAYAGNASVTGTVSGANATASNHFATLSQLQGTVSGTTGRIAKFTGTNTVGNSILYDYGSYINIAGDLYVGGTKFLSPSGYLSNISNAFGTSLVGSTLRVDYAAYSQPAVAGWYVVATGNASTNRGGGEFLIYSTGGSMHASSVKVEFLVDWSNNVTLFNTKGYINGIDSIRVITNSNTQYIEIKHAGTINSQFYLMYQHNGGLSNYWTLNQALTPTPTTGTTVVKYKTSIAIGAGSTTSNNFTVNANGIFSGTVSGANATASNHFATLSQLQGTVSGATGYISKFSGNNSINASNIYFDGGNFGVGTLLPSATWHINGTLLSNANITANYATKLVNNSTTGYGVLIKNGTDFNAAMTVRNAADNADAINLYGNGNAYFAGVIDVANAGNGTNALNRNTGDARYAFLPLHTNLGVYNNTTTTLNFNCSSSHFASFSFSILQLSFSTETTNITATNIPSAGQVVVRFTTDCVHNLSFDTGIFKKNDGTNLGVINIATTSRTFAFHSEAGVLYLDYQN